VVLPKLKGVAEVVDAVLDNPDKVLLGAVAVVVFAARLENEKEFPPVEGAPNPDIPEDKDFGAVLLLETDREFVPRKDGAAAVADDPPVPVPNVVEGAAPKENIPVLDVGFDKLLELSIDDWASEVEEGTAEFNWNPEMEVAGLLVGVADKLKPPAVG